MPNYYYIFKIKPFTIVVHFHGKKGRFKKLDELEKSRISDGFVKSSRSRLANPEE